jgi:hypothetical protein
MPQKNPTFGASGLLGSNRSGLRPGTVEDLVVATKLYFIHDPVASLAPSSQGGHMAKEDSITATGASGRAYEFEVYPWGQAFNPVGGVYLVLKRSPGIRPTYAILYVGQTGDLSRRFDDHHKQWCFDRNAKTHIGVRVVNTEQERLAIERDLLGNYQTVCNF